jgi:DNA polymerase-3 subunit delta'
MADFPLRPYPWQADDWKALTARVQHQRLAHALLFAGPQGLGKRQLALAFGQFLLCESPVHEGACGQCRSCRLFEAGNHPDLLLIEPEEEGKDLTVGQVREVSSWQALKPQYAGHKVILVAPADRMNQNAANALLKTLEEPTPGTVLLLVTDRPSGLLPTIRSRCQAMTLSAESGTALAWLAARTGNAAESLQPLLELAGNAPLRAAQLAEEGDEARQTVWKGLTQAAEGSASVSEIAGQWHSMGADKAFHWVHGTLCELIRARSGGGSGTLGSAGGAARLQRLTESIDLRALFKLLDRAQEAGRLLRAHANAQLLAEEFLLHWTMLFTRRARSQ